MKFRVKIARLTYSNDLKVWTDDDYSKLLEIFDFADVTDIDINERQEMLFMAISDFEPDEAAERVLEYKLGSQLSKGKIQSLSHEMLEDKVAEEYPDPELHYDLFNVNQLLYHAYDGTFPNTEASVIMLDCKEVNGMAYDMTEEIMTKLLSGALVDGSIIKRLYSDQIDARVAFSDGAKFIWSLEAVEDNSYKLITSRYWIEKEDIANHEFEIDVKLYRA